MQETEKALTRVSKQIKNKMKNAAKKLTLKKITVSELNNDKMQKLNGGTWTNFTHLEQEPESQNGCPSGSAGPTASQGCPNNPSVDCSEGCNAATESMVLC